MAASVELKALEQLAKLSGSFAVSALVAHSLLCTTSPTAHAYFSPVYVPLLELPYPVRRPSGKVVKDFRAKELGEKDVTYPVEGLLKSPWAAFRANSILWAVLKSLAVNGAVFLHMWLRQLEENEAARDEAIAKGADEDTESVELPPVRREDLERIARGGFQGGSRETLCTFVRRNLERMCTARVDDRLAWKLLKDHSTSAVRKVERLGRPRAVLLVARTTVRSMLLAQVADVIVSSSLDAWRLFINPYLPWVWVRLRRVRPRRGRGDPVEKAELAQDAAVARRAQREAPPLRARGGMLGRRVIGNAARSSVSLCAMAAGAGLVSGIHPGVLTMLAGNTTDLAVAVFVTGPELNEWYEKRRVPKVTFCLGAASAGLVIFFLLQGSNKGKIYVPESALQ